MTMLELKPRPGVEAPDGTARDGFAAAVLDGLARPQKAIPSRFFYDARGSELFERITGLDEYYPTRAEIEIFETVGAGIAARVPQVRTLIEFGSGSSRKIRALMSALPALDTYVPIDISGDMLKAEADALAADYPALRVMPVHADFTGAVTLPARAAQGPRLGFFPGSTIGNLVPREALQFLERVRALLGADGHLLIGVDLKKDEATLLRAYDDTEGVTAAFNLNLLARVNRELGGDFDLAAFAHRVRYDAGRGRIEMHLESLKAQTVHIAGQAFSFAAGETIHTENSHKFTLAEFRLLARAAGFTPVESWTDAGARFSVHLLAAAAA